MPAEINGYVESVSLLHLQVASDGESLQSEEHVTFTDPWYAVVVYPVLPRSLAVDFGVMGQERCEWE